MQKLFAYLFGAVIVMLLVMGIAGSQSADAGKQLGNGMACKFSSDCESGNCSFKVCKAKR